MKPYERGVLIEGLTEVATVAAAVGFLAMHEGLNNEFRPQVLAFAVFMGHSESMLEDMAAKVLQQEPTADDQFLSMDMAIPQAYEGQVTKTALNIASQLHPDPLVRQAATDILQGYEQSILDAAAGEEG